MNATSLLSTQRWTLAVVCAATAMLMLDIAVVNTALSDIAADLNTGLSGLQWVVDAYTLPPPAAIMFACSLAVLSNAFRTAEERAKAFAAYGAAIGASFAVGPLVGGALTSGLDWRFIFLVNLPLGLLCIGI